MTRAGMAMGFAIDGREPSDEALMGAVQQGDRAAGFELDRRWRPRLVGLARAILGDPEEAEDVAQLALWRVFMHADRYDRSRPFEKWIKAITRNCVLDFLRLLQRTPIDPGSEAGPATCKSAAADPPEIQEELAALRECRDGLRERSRTVIALWLCDFTFRQMGELLHEPRSTVQGWLHEALEQLRRCMDGKGFGDED